MRRFLDLAIPVALVVLGTSGLAAHAGVEYETEVLLIEDSSGDFDDNFGHSVAADGDWLAVGTPYDSGAGYLAGAVHLYKWGVGSFELIETIRAADAVDTDVFGFDVAMDGNVLIIGSPGNDEYAVNSGAVYVYEFSDSGASFKQKLGSGNFGIAEQFGTSVAIAGDYLLGGSPGTEVFGIQSGAVIVYEYDGGDWWYDGQLDPEVGGGGAAFGFSIDFDGTRAIVGAPYSYDAAGNPFCGNAEVFTYYPGFGFDTEGTLYSANPETAAAFGTSVSIDGSFLAIGSPYHNSFTGKVEFFNNDSGLFYSIQTVVPPADLVTGDYYGYSLHVSGNEVYVGTPLGSGGDSDTGCINTMKIEYSSSRGTYTVSEVKRYSLSSLTSGSGQVGFSVDGSGGKIYAGAPEYNSGAGAVMYFGEDRYWENPAGGFWEDAINWSGMGVPGIDSDVYFGLSNMYNVWTGNQSNIEIASLEVFDGDVTLESNLVGEFFINGGVDSSGLKVGTTNAASLTALNQIMIVEEDTSVGLASYGYMRIFDSYFATYGRLAIGSSDSGDMLVDSTNFTVGSDAYIQSGGSLSIENGSYANFGDGSSPSALTIVDGIFRTEQTATVSMIGSIEIGARGYLEGNGVISFNAGDRVINTGYVNPTLDSVAGDDVLELEGAEFWTVDGGRRGVDFEGRLVTSVWDGVDAAYLKASLDSSGAAGGEAILGGVYQLQVPAAHTIASGNTFRVLDAVSIVDNFTTYLVPYVDPDLFFRFTLTGVPASCPSGEIEDCNGNCCPDYWLGDGTCDDGTYDWNGIPIYLNCPEFNCDNGDCDPVSNCDGGPRSSGGERGGSGGGASIDGEVADLVIPFGFNSLVSGSTTNGEAISVRAMNVDGDSDDDLVILAKSTDSGDTVCVFLNEGGTLCLHDEIAVLAGPTDMAAGDFDNDGDEDLAVTCSTANKLVILRNDGGGDFTSILSADTGTNPTALTVFDWNNDSLPDIALVNHDDDTLYVYENSSTFRSIGFGTPNSSGTSENPSGIAPGDVDPGGDKDEDVVVSGANGEITYHINGGGTWDSTELFDAETTIGSLAVLDMDLDGFDDAFVSYPDSSESGVIYGPSGSLVEDVLPIDGSGFDAVDLDGDGDEDGTFEGPGGAGRGSIAIRVLRNDSDGQPIDVVVFMDVPGDDVSGSSTINTGMDVDSDGHQDLVAVANTSTPNFTINVQTSINGTSWTPSTCATDECLDPLPTTCPADVSGAGDAPDGFVNVSDLLAVIANWGQTGDGITRPMGDCRPLPNGDCTVNVEDLLGIISEWGATCSP